MPCYQVNTISVDFEAANLALLQKAAVVLGLEVRTFSDRRELVYRNGDLIATLRGGKAICRPADVAIVNRLRVQYSREIVNHAALKLGWQKSMKSENKLNLRKGF